MATQVILLERIEKLGQIGDVVSVRPGYARNFLLPQKKALRASKNNIAHFEAQKKSLLAANENAKKDAEKLAKKIDGIKASLIRQASESGQLYGSVTSRDIAMAIAEQSKETITKGMISINRNYKTIGLFPVDVILHPEVKAVVTINIARSAEEAETQVKTGKALIAEAEQQTAEVEAHLEDVLEDSALEIEKEKAEGAAEDAADEQESKAKSEVRKAKKAKKAAEKGDDAEGEAAAAPEAEAGSDE